MRDRLMPAGAARQAGSARANPTPRWVAAVAAFAMVVLGVVTLPAAQADGTPDVTLAVTAPSTALLGGTYPVTLTATNPTGTNGYNTSFQLVLPAGASAGSAVPAPTSVVARVDGSTALVWSNVSDLLASTSSSVTVQVAAGTLPLGSHTLTAGVYVHSDPRLVPAFDALGVAVPASYTGSATATSVTELVPFLITADVLRPENELVRGVHDQKTVVSVLVENNFTGPSSGLEVTQYLPATLEFLGCGSVDNTAAGVEEYPGSGRIDETAAPAMSNLCPLPSSVETLVVDPPGPQPSALYTLVRWDTATLAVMGWDALVAGESFTFDYVVGVPQNTNTEFAPGTETTGVQTANLDNNTGATTLETGTEQSATVVSALDGTYGGTDYQADHDETVTLEDLAIQKGVSTSAIVQGGLSTWTLSLQVSEYTTGVTGIVVTDTLPDGLCPLGAGDPDCAGGPAPSPAYASTLENPDGSWTLVWNLPDQVANATPEITFSTRTRTAYQEDGADQEPVRANDSWTNTVSVTGTATDLTGAVREVADVSSAGQTAASIVLTKEVAAPDGGGQCAEGAAWESGTSSVTFGPGDIVCWRMTISTPSGLDTTGLQLTDFLPAGYGFVSAVETSTSDVAIASQVVATPRIDWTFTNGGDLDESSFAQIILTTRIDDPTAAEYGDLLGNLAKLHYENTPSDVFQLRSEAIAPWRAADLSLVKNSSVGTAQGGTTVTYTIAISNDGNTSALDVQVRDLLPAAIDCTDLVTPLTGGLVCTDAAPRDRLDTTIAAIAAGATANLTYDVVLPTELAPGQVLTNNAGVRLYDVATNDPAEPRFEYQPATNIDPTLTTPNTDRVDDSQTVTITAVTITKTATSMVETGNTAAQATIGEDIIYTVQLTLPHDTTLTSAVLSDTVPTQVLLDTTTAQVTRNDSATPAAFVLSTTSTTVTLTFPTPYTVGSVDEVIIVTFTGQVRDASTATFGTNVSNTARLHYADAGGTFLTDRTSVASIRLVEPRIAVVKAELDADNVASPGEQIAFTVSVTNPGTNASPNWTSTAHEIVVVDTIPDSMTPLGAGGVPLVGDGAVVPDGGWWDATARTITWTIASLAPNAAAVVLDYQAEVDDPIVAPSTFANTAVVTTSSLAGTVAGERVAGGFSAARYSASSVVALNGPRPYVTKTADVSTAAPGEGVTYTITAFIPPSVTTYDVTVLDTLPAGLTYLGTTSAACTAPDPCDISVTTLTPDGQRLGWFLGDLAPSDDQREVTIVYRAFVADSLDAQRGDVLTNAATVGFSDTDNLGTPLTPPLPAEFGATSPIADVDVTVTEPTLTLSKTVAQGAVQVAQRRVLPDEAVTYSVTLTNTGTSTAHDIEVSDLVDDRMLVESIVDGPVGTWVVTDADPADGTLGFAVAALAAGDSLTITYQLRVPALTSADEVVGAEISNTADAVYTSAVAGSPGAPREYDDVVADQVDLEVDLASLGDLVWFDTVGDGVPGVGEPGVAGATVTVVFLGADGVLGGGDDETHLATTAADGSWLIENLPGGAYQVSVTDLPTGTEVTTDLSGTPAAGGPVALVLAQDADRRDADFGIRGTADVGDLVWLDLDADGVVDPGEPGLDGVGVDVTWYGLDSVPGTGDDLTYRALTGADGTWSVDGVPPGDVVVTIDPTTFPAGLGLASDPDAGAADGTATGSLAAGASDLGYDFGLRGTGLIGDRLWLDLNADGIQDPGEPGIPGAGLEVRWYGLDGVSGSPDDAVVAVTTGADGSYEATSLPPGDFDVIVTSLPTGVASTYDEDTGTTGPDGRTSLALADGAAHRTADFGFVAVTGVGDLVWLDLNGDGVADADEPGLPGVGISVTSAGADGALGTSDDITLTTTTGPDGTWLVTGLPASLTLVEVTTGLPGAVVPSYDADGIGTPGSSTVTLVDGATVLDQDFGYTGPNSIGDRVWVDIDRDGAQDAGEPGLGGLTVELTWLGADALPGGGDDVVVQVVTDSSGSYLIPGLMNGDFAVAVVAGIPAGYTPTADETGPADNASTVIALGDVGPQDHLSADFGYGGEGGLGGLVWLDRNADGVVDAPSEAGVGTVGIDVTWAGPDGTFLTTDDVTIYATTDSDGGWALTGLPPGSWTAVVDPTTVPLGTTVVFDRDDGLVAPDGAWAGTLDPMQVRTDVDTGLRGTASLGSLVWVDTNRDGVHDPGEPGAAGVDVTVTWLGADGMPDGGDDVEMKVTTGSDGGYTVDGLPAGTYVVTFDVLTLPAGTTAASDLDGGNPLVTTAELTDGQVRIDVNLRLIPGLSLTGAGLAGLALLVLIALLLLGTGMVLVRRRELSRA